jgi:hypothetical protein
MFSKNPMQRISSSICAGLLVGGLLWLMVLIQSSRTMYRTSQAIQIVRLGPFELNKLSKKPLQTGGYSVAVSFENGFIPYLLSWSAIGGTYALARIYYYKHKQL